MSSTYSSTRRTSFAASGLGLAQIAFRVVECVPEHEETISDRFELLAGDDELVFTETELERAPTGLVVALAACLLAIEPRSSRAVCHRDPPAAPATRGLRHSDDITERHPLRRGCCIGNVRGMRRRSAVVAACLVVTGLAACSSSSSHPATKADAAARAPRRHLQGPRGRLHHHPGRGRRGPARRLGADRARRLPRALRPLGAGAASRGLGRMGRDARRAHPRHGSQRRRHRRHEAGRAAMQQPRRRSGSRTARRQGQAGRPQRSRSLEGRAAARSRTSPCATSSRDRTAAATRSGGTAATAPAQVGCTRTTAATSRRRRTYAGGERRRLVRHLRQQQRRARASSRTRYASNMSDSGYYVGACPDCNATLDDAHAQYSALGYSGTNSGGHLIVQNSEFDHNKTGFSTNSQNNDDAPSPQDGVCPNGAIGPTGTRSCWIFEHNFVHDNNNANVPGHGSADLGPPGTGHRDLRRTQRHRHRQPLREQRQLGGARRSLPRHRHAAAHRPLSRAAIPTAFRGSASRPATSTRGATTSRTTRSRTTAASPTRRTATSPRSRAGTRPGTAGTRTPIPAASPPRRSAAADQRDLRGRARRARRSAAR